MAELHLKDGRTKLVSYNTAAKIYQIQQGNTVNDPRLTTLKKLASQVTSIDFKKLAR